MQCTEAIDSRALQLGCPLQNKIWGGSRIGQTEYRLTGYEILRIRPVLATSEIWVSGTWHTGNHPSGWGYTAVHGKTSECRANEKPINMVAKGPLSCRPFNRSKLLVNWQLTGQNRKISNRQAMFDIYIKDDDDLWWVVWLSGPSFMLASHQRSLFACNSQDMQHPASSASPGKFNNWPSSGAVLADHFSFLSSFISAHSFCCYVRAQTIGSSTNLAYRFSH